jgi:8-amino-7-oxononanoate synthase
MIAERYPEMAKSGSTGSRLLSGNDTETEELEQLIARFHGADAALLFNSGFDANTGLISCISDRHTIVLYDDLCHASIIDGTRGGWYGGKYKFVHNDLAELEELLMRYKDKGPIVVVVEAVYSMDGDKAALQDIANLCEQFDAALFVDEAHATGVVGERGEGLVSHLGLRGKVLATVHTYGKALGCHGAAVLGSPMLKQFLINFSRPFIYTTALPQHSVRSIACAYQYLESDGSQIKDLRNVVTKFRELAGEYGLVGLIDSDSPIQAVLTRDIERTTRAADRLYQAGLKVGAIKAPTVKKGSERLRICLHSFNTSVELEKLVQILRDENFSLSHRNLGTD